MFKGNLETHGHCGLGSESCLGCVRIRKGCFLLDKELGGASNPRRDLGFQKALEERSFMSCAPEMGKS